MNRHPQCPSARKAEGHCPFRGTGAAGVIPAVVSPVQGCNSAPGSSLPVVYSRCPAWQEGGRACRTVPLPRALCPVVVSLPPVVAAVPSVQSKPQPAVGPTLHSRGTAHQGTGHSVPLCLPVIRGAVAPARCARATRADRVGNRPQWPITGRSPAGHSSEMDTTRMTQTADEACASPATTGPRPSIPQPVGDDRRARRGPQGGHPPPARQAGSSARPGFAPTHFGRPPRTKVGGAAGW